MQGTSTNNTEPDSMPALNGTNLASATSKPEQERAQTPTPSQPQTQPVKTSTQSQETTKKTSLGITQAFNSFGGQIHKGPTSHTAAVHPHSPQPARPKAHTIGQDKWGSGFAEFCIYKKDIASMLFILISPHSPFYRYIQQLFIMKQIC